MLQCCEGAECYQPRLPCCFHQGAVCNDQVLQPGVAAQQCGVHCSQTVHLQPLQCCELGEARCAAVTEGDVRAAGRSCSQVSDCGSSASAALVQVLCSSSSTCRWGRCCMLLTTASSVKPPVSCRWLRCCMLGRAAASTAAVTCSRSGCSQQGYVRHRCCSCVNAGRADSSIGQSQSSRWVRADSSYGRAAVLTCWSAVPFWKFARMHLSTSLPKAVSCCKGNSSCALEEARPCTSRLWIAAA